MSVELWEIILGIVVALLGFAGRWLAARSWATEAERQFFEQIALVALAVKHNVIEGMTEALKDGVITAEESKKIREDAYRLAMDSLKGPALQFAKDRGRLLVEHHLGGIIDSIMEKFGVKPKLEAVIGGSQ